MSSPGGRSVRVVRLWCDLYTRGLPHDARERRRLELESDMWEHLHDPDETDAKAALIGRFLRGIPADVRWRYRTLLDSRGARQRSEEMDTTQSRSWWAPLTAVFAVVLLAVGGLVVVTGGSDDAGAVRLVGAVLGALSGGLVLAGLARRRRHLVQGSRFIVVGGVIALVGGLELIPVAVLILISGFWTGNLRLSDTGDEVRLHADGRLQMQSDLTRHWVWWIGVAAVCFALGWVPLIVDNPDDLASSGYFIWVLSWLAAIITGGVGLVLACLRVVVRHRTRLA